MSRTHEQFREHFEVRASSDRGFGLTLGGIAAAIGFYVWVFGAPGGGWLAGLLVAVGVTLAGLGWFAADHLAPLNRLWTRLGVLLLSLIGPLVAFVIFVLAVVPIGLVMRAGGHDPLRLRKDPASTTYWIERHPPGPAPDTMTEQF
jgi:hypothetical protein